MPCHPSTVLPTSSLPTPSLSALIVLVDCPAGPACSWFLLGPAFVAAAIFEGALRSPEGPKILPAPSTSPCSSCRSGRPDSRRPPWVSLARLPGPCTLARGRIQLQPQGKSALESWFFRSGFHHRICQALRGVSTSCYRPILPPMCLSCPPPINSPPRTSSFRRYRRPRKFQGGEIKN